MMDAQTIGAIAALFAALGTLINAIQNVISYRQGTRNANISRTNTMAIGAVSKKVSAVDAKVEGVAEQTNGHMTSLIAAVAPVDPVLATTAALKMVQSVETVAEKLKARTDDASTKEGHD